MSEMNIEVSLLKRNNNHYY